MPGDRIAHLLMILLMMMVVIMLKYKTCLKLILAFGLPND